MQGFLDIINDNFLDKFSKLFSKPKFYGNIYSLNSNGNLEIDRNTLNKLVNKVNIAFKGDKEGEDLLTLNEVIYLAFINEQFEESESLWREDRNYYFSAIVTDYGVLSLFSEETTGFNKEPDQLIISYWKKTEHVELVELYNEEDNYYALRFFEKNGTSKNDIPLNRFGTSNKKSGDLLVDLFNELIKHKSQKDLDSFSKKKELEDGVFLNIKEGNFTEANTLLEKYSEMYDVHNPSSMESSIYYKNKSIVLENLGEYNDALFTINKMIEMTNGIGKPSPTAHKIKGDILLKKGNILEGINSYAYSEEYSEKIDETNNLKKIKESTYLKVKESFTELPYDSRKLILTTNDIYNTNSNDLVLLKKDDLPLNIKFPIGHPHLNELYTCHPLKSEMYFPLKDFTQDLFLDKVNEFTYLLQCLGATKIEISSSKNDIIENERKQNVGVSGEGGVRAIQVSGEHNRSTLRNDTSDNNLKIQKTQIFKPTKAPYIPNDLIWFNTEMSWQRFADQRLNGNISHHSETITSVKTETISTQEITNAKLEIKSLLHKLNVSYNKEEESKSSNKSSFEWVISVDFDDIDTLIETQPVVTKSTSVNPNIEKYRDDVLLMLEDDDKIDDSERQILDRKINRYGLSKEEAQQIEEEVLSTMYSEKELLYIEELKGFIADGELSDLEFKMLERYAKKYGIDEEAKKRIDSLFVI